MSDPQLFPEEPLPDDERRVDAEGVDPDIVTNDERPEPELTSPAEEDAPEDDEDIDLSTLP